MSLSQTLVLGLIAGATILLGLPVGRLHGLHANTRQMLNALAIGILLFLFWDVLSAAWEPVDVALGGIDDGGLGPVLGYGGLLFAGLAVGLLTLVWYERWLTGRAAALRAAAAEPRRSAGPGAMASSELAARGLATWSPARRLALFIAIGIGLHNFAEGLAIGQSSASGDIALATLLVIGFALHNATEGFGIVAPLAADVDSQGRSRVPSWGFLLLLGAIGGGPTFVGTVLGYSVVNEAVAVAFLALAAGSILYVVLQLVGVASKPGARRDLLAYGVLLGLFAGFLTDAIVTAGGA